ncbi:glycerophosphodiester phosphodiesterase [Pedobacter psychroterrae]|uniref:glycerophosphodiester phosphodiesterase n=1 Tax=Pedobacter psychroterrae TaxID=2530453 RepID=UPI001981F1A4|nr:glycerophosphodiester phosphodiesterase family protein [Pedobacter psychroterrae]
MILYTVSLSATAQELTPVKGVTAHRGFSAAYPENTLTAFQTGINAGADWVELDIHKTKDGQIVVSHDGATGRAADKNLIITESTYKQLQELDIATAFRKSKGLTETQCPPEKMPLLSDAIKLILKQKAVKLSIQPKADCVADAIKIVRELSAEHMVGFNDASLKYMSQVKQLAPKIPVFWDRGPETNITEDILTAKEKGFETLVINYKGITAEKVRQVKAAGLKVGTWTVSDKATLLEMIDLGLDRIYTDDPALLIRLY